VTTPNFSIVSNQTLANKTQSKKIVNISRCVTPPLPVPITKINQISSNSTTLATIRLESIDNKTVSQTPIVTTSSSTANVPLQQVKSQTDKQIDTQGQSTPSSLINTIPRKRRKQDLKKINDELNKKQLNPLHINGISSKKQDNLDKNNDNQQLQQQINDDFYLDDQYDEIDDNDDSIMKNVDLDLSPPPTKITKLSSKINSTKKLPKNSASPSINKTLKMPNSKYISKQTIKNFNIIDDDTMKKLSMGN
jgi:hypothetical protein